MDSIPVLKSGIVVRDFDSGTASSAPRFLLELGAASFLLGGKSRALVLALMDAEGDGSRLEARYAEETGEPLPAAELVALAKRCVPAVLLVGGPDHAPVQPFTLRMTVWPASRLGRVTAALAPLFEPRVAAALLLLFAVLHAAVLPSAMRAMQAPWSALDPIWLLCGLMASGLLHELGHVSACRRFGCAHGDIGFGLYFIFPTWFADVSKAWRLGPRQRAVVDLGGVYFQAIQLLFLDTFAWVCGDLFAWRLVWATTFMMLFTLNPVFKFDGYWLLSDLSGLPNLHRQLARYARECLGALSQGRWPAARRGRSGLLAAYAAMSAAYLLYFGHFLVSELIGLSRTLPPALSHGLAAIAAATAPLPRAEAMLALALVLAWPLLLSLSSVALLVRLQRRAAASLRETAHGPGQGPDQSTIVEGRP